MLASSISRSSSKITVTVNGRSLKAKKGETILALCDRNGIRVPRLCFHPCLPPSGTCGLCVVQVENHGAETFSNACVTKVANGIRVNTLHQRVIDQVRNTLTHILDTHDERCSACVANQRCEFRNLCYDHKVSSLKDRLHIKYKNDDSTHAIHIDPSKCVDCKRCVRACNKIAGMKILKVAPLQGRNAVQIASGLDLYDTTCIRCGQCVLFCPVGALTERTQSREVLEKIRNHGKKVNVCELGPGVHIALADALGLTPQQLTPQRLVSCLKAIGFDYVLDAKFGGDLMIMEEAATLVEKIKKNELKAPFFSSNCPSFVNYIEQSRPSVIPNLSTLRSAPSILSSLVMEVLPAKLNIRPLDIFNVSVTCCLSKKDEIERPQYQTKVGLKNIDVSLSVRELVDLFHIAHINPLTFKETPFDTVLGTGSGAAELIDTSGGYMEATLRTAHWMLTGKNPAKLEMKELRGDKALKVMEVKLGDHKIHVAAVQGMVNAIKFFDKVKKDKKLRKIKYVEVMACPGGCVCGGGTSILTSKEAIKERCDAIYKDEAKSKIRFAHENPCVQDIYKTLLEKPNSQKVHDLLHAHFSRRPGF